MSLEMLPLHDTVKKLILEKRIPAICLRVAAFPNLSPDRSCQGKCVACHELIWIHPNTRAALKTYSDMFLCCAECTGMTSADFRKASDVLGLGGHFVDLVG